MAFKASGNWKKRKRKCPLIKNKITTQKRQVKQGRDTFLL
jgi:hypothetical protein